MIPKLYKKNGTTLIGNLPNCIECLVEEERNGLFELTLTYPNTSVRAPDLVYDNIIVCDANDILTNQKFRIYDTRRLMNNTVEVYARHISFDLAYDYINSIDITNQSCEYALNTIFRNSQFCTGYVGHSDIVNAQNYKISNCNALEAIAGKQGSIIDTYGTGAEILRNNTDIYVLNKRGNDNEVSIEYAKNLTGFELQENTDDLITRIIPFATYTPEGGQQTRVQGSAIDSQYINNYSHPFIAELDFSDKFEDNEVPTPAKLNTMAQRYFEENKCDLPKQNWKIEFIPLSKCVGYESLEDAISLCDTVTIKDTRYNINTKAKVIKTVYDVLRERYDSMELGEPRTTLGDIVNTGSEKGEQGPPGPQGPAGADGNIGDFPDSLPNTPVLSYKLYGFASIELSWTYERQVYYQYELYASKTKNFTPNTFDIIHKGQTSSFLFQAKPNETWYFRVCGINSYGNRTAFSDQITVTTVKIDDLSNYVDNAAIGDALIGTLSLDRGWYGELRGNYIDAKQLSVTDGNGKRTLDIDSFGNVNLDVASLKINSSDVATKTYSDNSAKNAVDGIYLGGENLLRNTDYNIETATSFYSASNGGVLQRTEYTFGNNLDSDMFIRNNYVLRNRYDIATANTNYITYSMTKWNDNVVLQPNTDYTLTMYLYKGTNCGETYFSVYPIVNGEIGTRVCKSDSITKYTGGFVKLSKTFNTGLETTFSVRIYNYHSSTKTEGNSDVIIFHPKLEKGNKESQWSPSSLDMATIIETESKIEQSKESILLSVSKTYATTTELNSVDDKFASYSTTKEMNSAITQKADSITSSVSKTYATKTEVGDVDKKFENYSTTKEMNSAITQKADEITAKVETVDTKAKTNYINQVVNSNCLNSIEGWYTPHSDKISTYITTSDKPESKNAIRLDCRESRVYMNSKKFPVTPGETYTVSMWAQRQPYNSFVRMYMMFSDNNTADNNYFDTYSYKTWDSNDGDNTWVYKSMTVTVPEGASYAFIKVGAESTQTTTNYDGRGYFCSLMCNKGDEAATWTGNTNDSYMDLSGRVSSAEVKISDTISSTVRKDGVISSINQSAEAVKVKAKKIELNGAVTIADSNGDSVKIDDADYSIMNGSTERGFFGLRKLDDDRKIARLAMSHSGLDKAKNNYFVATAYPATNNPIDSEKSYFDLAYRCQMFTSPSTGVGDVSNIRMLGTGDITVAPIKNLQIRSNYVNGAYAGDTEHLIAEFGTSSSEYYSRYLSIQTIMREGTSNGLLLCHKNDNGNIALVRVICQTESDGTVFRAFSPLTTAGNIRLGSASYPWYRCYATLSESVTSDRRRKDNIEYIGETQNPNAARSTEYTLEDMYNFVKDDLALATYNMKNEENPSGLKYGFIAQDIVNTKVGYNIIDQSNEDDYIGYDTMNYTNALAGALKEAINKIEQQQEQIDQLTSLVNQLINKEGEQS